MRTNQAIAVLWTLIGYLLLQVQNASSARSTGILEIIEPAGSIAYSEIPDYATLVWNDPWDMADPLDVRQLDSPQCVYANHFNSYEPCPDGIWCGQVRSDVGNPDLFILHPGYSGSLHVGRDGNLRPISANYYTQLTFRMYISYVDPSDPGLQIYWTNGTVAEIGGDPNRYGGSRFYKTYSGWHIYTIDLSKETSPMNGNLPWSGQLTGLRLDPGFTNMNNKIVQLDWVRLSPRQTRRIRWSTDQNGPLTIRFQSGGVNDDLLIYSGGHAPITIMASQGYYDVPVSLPPGDWYIQVQVNTLVSSLAGPWRIQAAPTLTFLSPSYTSGEDYSLTNLGYLWDMNDPRAVYSYGNMSMPIYSNGILSATSTTQPPPYSCTEGPWGNSYMNFLNDEYWKPPFTTSPPIDTGKYRYVTFRVKLDGTPDVSWGWGARVGWSNLLFTNCGITKFIPLHGGWNTVSIDLWNTSVVAQDDPCQSAWRAVAQRNQLRFDPTESPVAVNFHVDYIKLTANDMAQRNSTFQIKYLLNKTAGVSVTFYYDTDTNPANGRTLANQVVSSSSGSYKVYLPLIVNSSQSQNNPAERVFNWNLAGVPPGTYYISADVNDGYQTTTWYSETPMIVKP